MAPWQLTKSMGDFDERTRACARSGTPRVGGEDDHLDRDLHTYSGTSPRRRGGSEVAESRPVRGWITSASVGRGGVPLQLGVGFADLGSFPPTRGCSERIADVRLDVVVLPAEAGVFRTAI